MINLFITETYKNFQTNLFFFQRIKIDHPFYLYYEKNKARVL